MHNEELCRVLFSDWEIERARKLMDDMEAVFRRLASEQLKPVTGLDKLCKWVEDHGLKRAAVTNTPRSNAELIISRYVFLRCYFHVSGIKVGVADGMPVVGLATRNPEKLLSDAGAIVVSKDFADSKLWMVLEDLEKKTKAVKITT